MAKLNTLTVNNQEIWDIVYPIVYPINTIYETKDSSFNPQDLWGGLGF